MDFEFNEEQKMWHKTINDFIDKEGGREYYRKCDMEGHYPDELYNKMIKQGYWGLLMPKKFGGKEVGGTMFCITEEAVGKYGYDIASGYGTTNFNPTIVGDHGSDTLRNKYIPRFMKGEIKFSMSLTEPGSGSDAASLTTEAIDKGDHWLINGQKVFSTAAQVPNNVIICCARTDKTVKKHQGISIFLVPNTTPGVEMHLLPLIARRATGTNEIFFKDVKIPKENLVGELNKGWDYILEGLNIERLSISSAFVGNSQTAVSDALRYANQRVQFGQPIAKFQSIAFMLADMQTEVDASRLLVYRGAWMYDKKLHCTKEAAMGKVFAAETFQRVTTNGMQILGGYSLLPQSDMERYWREAKGACFIGGTVQIMRMIISREMGAGTGK